MGSNSSKNEKLSIMKRYSLVMVTLTLAFLFMYGYTCKSVLCSSRYSEYNFWKNKDSMTIEAKRGSIYDCNGNLMAITSPYYQLYWDCMADGLKDSVFKQNVDSIAYYLSSVFHEPVADTKANLVRIRRMAYADKEDGKRPSRHVRISKRKINYLEKMRLEKAPLIKKGPNVSGFSFEEKKVRELPYNNLAFRTIGIYNSNTDYATCGLEKQFDSILKGECGYKDHEGKPILEAEDGMNVVTTIDINMQDITETALKKWMNNWNGLTPNNGCAILMEAATGHIKAICNLQRTKNGELVERENYAVNRMTEPGSTFKTASLMVALDEGKVDTSEVFDTGNGIWNEYGRMTDHKQGGFGPISLARAMEVSSNIGIAKMVDKYYGDSKKSAEHFYERLYDLRLKEHISFPIPGTSTPKFLEMSAKSWKADMLWASFGYNTQIPPLYTLNFYNAIANNGRMMSPMLVKAYQDNEGNVVRTFSPKVTKNKICTDHTLRKVQAILRNVVVKGTGRNFNSKSVEIAGKTGTTQIGYGLNDKARKDQQLSFCGYFPANDPKYSCIVMVWGFPEDYVRNGGAISQNTGQVFKDIAERIYAKSPSKDATICTDSTLLTAPKVCKGKTEDTHIVLKHLKSKHSGIGDNAREWVRMGNEEDNKKLALTTFDFGEGKMPNLKGMAAKDAIYLLEKQKMSVQINGYGPVEYQSIEPGRDIKEGQKVILSLKYRE